MRMKRFLAYFLILSMIMGNTVTASASGNVTVAETVEGITTQELTGEEILLQESSTEEASKEEPVDETVTEEMETKEPTVEETATEESSEEEIFTSEASTEGISDGTEEGTTEEIISEEISSDESTEEESIIWEMEVAEEPDEKPNVNLYAALEENGEYVLQGSYTSLQKAFDVIDELGNSTDYYRVEMVSADWDEVSYSTKDLVFPVHAGQVTVCAGSELTEPCLYFKGNLTLKSNLVFEDIILVPASDTVISLGKYELTLSRCRLDDGGEGKITAINGSSITGTSALILEDTDIHVTGTVTNVGRLIFKGVKEEAARTINTVGEAASLKADGKIQVGDIELETDGYLTGAATVTRKNGKITKIEPQIIIGGEVYSTDRKTLYLDLQEKVSGEYIWLDLDKAEASDIQEMGVPFAKAGKVTYPNIKAAQKKEADSLIKSGGYLTYYAEGYGVILSFEQEGEEVTIPCLTFSDAVTEINNRKIKQDYVITLTKDSAVASGIRQDILSTVPKALTMPDKKYVNSLVIQADSQAGDAQSIQLGFTGNITFTSNVTLRNVSFVQLVKSGSSYVPADTAKNDYPVAVTVKSGGFDVKVEGCVTFNTPVVLNGGNKGTLTLNETGSIHTITNDYTPKTVENVIYGSVTGWKDLTVSGCDLTIKEYRTSRTGKTYKASANKVTALNLTDCTLKVIGDNAKGSLTVQVLYIDNGEVYVGGKVSIKNATLEGTQKATVFADTNFTITGTLTSKSNNATLLTRLKGTKKAPYLQVDGKVVRETGVKPIYVGVYPEVTASSAIKNKPVTLTDAPKVTAQLLTANSALAVDFRPIAENYSAGSGEYHKDNTSGYMMLKSGKNIYVYDGSTVKVAVYVKDETYVGNDDGELFGFFPSIKNATSAVNARKDKSAYYTYVLMDVNGTTVSPVTINLPSYAKQVTLKSIADCREEMKTITFTGSINLGADTVLENIILSPVKNKKATTVTINGKNKMLTLKGTDIPGSVKDASVLNIKENTSVSGNVTVTKLRLENTADKQPTTLSVDGTVTVTDIANCGEKANILEYKRTAKGTATLTVNGSITNEKEDVPVIFRQTDTKTVNLLTKDGNKVTLSGSSQLAVMPKASTDSFVAEGTTFIQDNVQSSVADVILVKASKGVYAIDDEDSDILRDVVTLEEVTSDRVTQTRCLDYTQAVNEINNRNRQTSEYRILFEAPNAVPTDTNLTDKNSYGGLPLPKKNKAISLTLMPVHDGYTSIPYTGNITGYGNITFEKLALNPVKSASNAAPGTSSLKIAADKSGANITFDTCANVFLTSGINVAGIFTLKDTKVLSDKASTVKHLVLDAAASLDSLGKLTLTQATAPEGVNTAYVGVKQDGKGVPQFVLQKDVNSGILQIRIYDKSASTSVGTSILEGNCEKELDSYLDVSLVSAKNGTPGSFRAYPYRIIAQDGTIAENEDGITKENLVAYKQNNYIKNGTAQSMLTASGRSQLLSAARDAKAQLEELVKEKDMYALVYMTDSYEVKEAPSHESATIATLNSAHTVQILGMEVEWNYLEESDEYVPTVWYYVQFYVGDTLYRGYIEEAYLAYSDEILLQWKEDWKQLFADFNVHVMDAQSSAYADVEKFPTSYQVHLKKLKDSHPNWTFVPMNVGRNWDDCVNEQMGDYSWIYYNQPAEFRGAQINSTWYYASRAGIAYYMDPRNFLTESNIFQFEQNTYNASYHTQSALQSFLNGTFMAGKIPDDGSGRTYANIIWNSGKDRGLSPFNLAARVIQEQGVNGNSAMISGTYAGYEGYYNFYNIGASGTTNAEVLKNGLTYAKNQGWNTRVKSLNGGAAFIGNGYILKGQDTLYLQKFDIEHGNSALHQYMQNIMAPYTEGRSMKSMYTEAGSLSSGFVFKIPVFENMSGADYTISPKSVKIEKGKTKQIKVLCDGIAVSQDQVEFESADKTIATVSQTGLITAVKSGKTTITATVGEGDSEIKLTCRVEVYAPLKSILLSTEYTDLYVTDGLPDKIPLLDENGKTQYLSKEDCPSQTTLTVTYNPEDTTDDRTVKWIVEKPEVLSVVQDENNVGKALVTAKRGGTTKVTAKVGAFTSEVTITVRVPMTEASLKLEEEKLTLYKGQSVRVNVSYLPYETTDSIDPVFRSENEAVARIENGDIIAVGPGTTTIHAAVGPFDGTQTALTCKITVKEYTVTFLDEMGRVLLEATGEYGNTLEYLKTEKELPWSMESEGKLFMGWYTEADGKGYAVDEKTVLYSDLTLYPYFVEATSGFDVKPIGNVDYTGAYLKPEVEVYSGGTLLRKGFDYYVTYQNNKMVNDPSDSTLQPVAVITGKKDYAGIVVMVEFDIVPKNISHTDVMAGDLLVSYTGKEQQLRPVLYDGGRTLQWKVDYTLSYPEDEKETGAYSEAGTYPVEITGIGNYSGTRTVHISISKRTLLSGITIAAIKNVKFNNGKEYKDADSIEECKPAVSLTNQGRKLVENTDYTLMYRDNREIGVATVIITGMGDYIGTVEKSFEITGTNVSTAKIKGVTGFEYTGDAVVQNLGAIKVTDKNGILLRDGLDYLLSYEKNESAGTAYMVLTGINGYTGVVKTPFTIKPYDIVENAQTYEGVDENGAPVSKPAFEVVSESGQTEQEQNGNNRIPIVTFKGKTLTEGVDYKLTYPTGQAESGDEGTNTTTVTVKGIGNFAGTITCKP